MLDFYQTGDVLFFPLGYDNCVDPIATEIPKDAKARTNLVVQEGRTGNTHALSGEGTIIFDHEGKVFIDVMEEAIATHGEHTDVALPAGQYEVRNVQEHDVFTGLVRAVID